jgi:uncharacterized protein YifE (UPF0438 family)
MRTQLGLQLKKATARCSKAEEELRKVQNELTEARNNYLKFVRLEEEAKAEVERSDRDYEVRVQQVIEFLIRPVHTTGDLKC